jgi:hypothetical protein
VKKLHNNEHHSLHLTPDAVRMFNSISVKWIRNVTGMETMRSGSLMGNHFEKLALIGGIKMDLRKWYVKIWD